MQELFGSGFLQITPRGFPGVSHPLPKERALIRRRLPQRAINVLKVAIIEANSWALAAFF